MHTQNKDKLKERTQTNAKEVYKHTNKNTSFSAAGRTYESLRTEFWLTGDDHPNSCGMCKIKLEQLY